MSAWLTDELSGSRMSWPNFVCRWRHFVLDQVSIPHISKSPLFDMKRVHSIYRMEACLKDFFLACEGHSSEWYRKGVEMRAKNTQISLISKDISFEHSAILLSLKTALVSFLFLVMSSALHTNEPRNLPLSAGITVSGQHIILKFCVNWK